MKSDCFEKCQLCISLGATSPSHLLKEIKQATQWADLIEIRLDKLENIDFSFLSLLKERKECSFIWTLRKKSHGGSFEGSEEERFYLLQSLFSQLQPTFFDLEGDTPAYIIRDLQKLSPQTHLILSWHDLVETPKDLEEIYQSLSQFPAAYYKIATLAHSTTDAVRMLKFTRKMNEKKRVLCGICLGEWGQSTRILGAMTGQPFTFASLEKGKETALGQLTAEELVMTYRFHEMNRETQLFGLIGNPVDKSVSQFTHNAIFRDLSLNAVYVKFHLEEKEFSSFFNEITSFPIKGLSVTTPFKEKALSLLKEPHDLVACNTLLWSSSGWKGTNTDGIGAVKALGLDSLENQKMVILGAGGTAKAIAQAAHQKGASLAILNRTLERAKKIAAPLKARWGALEELSSLVEEGYGYIIQATSVGMAPAFEATPVHGIKIGKKAIVLDVISNPPETCFLREIKKQGGVPISGRELFIHQAVEQFVYWFGPSISSEKVERILRQQFPKEKKKECVYIKNSVLRGSISLPPSKSHTIRAILLAAFAKGTSYVHYPLNSPDTTCAIQAASQFGAKVITTSTGFAIQGIAGEPRTPCDVIQAGNSGQVLRFAGALAALSEGYTLLTGDDSIRSNRPIQPLLEGLKGLKAEAFSTCDNGYAPFIVKGPLQPGKTYLEGNDSQPVSALLMAAAFVDGETEMQVRNAGEKPWLALTLSWLDRLKVDYTHRQFEHFIIQGKRIRPAFEVTIPGDLSSLAFPVAAALITKSELIIENVDLQDVQGDKAMIFLLQEMGACFEIDISLYYLKVFAKGKLKGRVIDVNDFIDAVPILAVLGCFAEGETEIINASIARKKESNRLTSITTELKKMGAFIEETEDGLKIRQSQLKGACLNSHGDHRIAMSLIIAGLGAEGETEVQGIECISKSYPTFLEDFRRIGAKLS